ncbi:MAG: hypothetical protein MJZ69_05615 [Bacteroidaceae bacterium]|nr:hypothetical protein [Candidatus Minthousia equi]MCQ2246251.1 hypothetical protein [Bacteroidaceae bacterium]MDO4956683.1 hypothetical protein [Bacteroidales bacterium]
MKKTILLGTLILTLFSSCQKSWEEKCVEDAQVYTETRCPYNITPTLAIDSMIYNPKNNCLLYYYSALGNLDNPELFTEEKKADYKIDLKQTLINDISTRQYKEHDVTFRYIYKSRKTKDVLLDIKFESKDYK